MMDELYFVPFQDHLHVTLFNKLITLVSSDKREHIKRFRCDIDKKISLYSELLIRILVYHMLGLSNSRIQFDKREYGKPYLKGYPNFCFNLSHTRNAIAAVISDSPVGVDIEKVANAELQIASRFFTPDELKYIMEIADDRNKRFYEIWTKKEAYVKYLGCGLRRPLYTFDVLDENLLKNFSLFERGDYIISVYSKKNFNILEIDEDKIAFECGRYLTD